MCEEISNSELSNEAIHRLIDYLTAEGWTSEKILDLICFLTKE